MPLMSSSAKECYRSLTESCRTSVKQETKDFYLKVASYLQKNLHPLNSSLVRNLRVLYPKVSQDLKDGGNQSIIKAAKTLKCLSVSEVDSLEIQWDLAKQSSITLEEKGRIDNYYDKVIRDIEVKNSAVDFTPLRKFIQTVLILPSSNSLVERGFSQNKIVLQNRERMTLPSLIGQRVTKEAIRYYGGSDLVPITASLRAKQLGARHNYRMRLELEQKTKKATEQEHIVEREACRKRTAQEIEQRDFDSKRTKLETDEKSLRDGITFLNVQLQEMMLRAKNSTIMAEIHASMAAQLKLREQISEKETELQKNTTDMKKLLNKRLNKK